MIYMIIIFKYVFILLCMRSAYKVFNELNYKFEFEKMLLFEDQATNTRSDKKQLTIVLIIMHTNKH